MSINEQDLAYMANKLQVPVIVGKVLDGDQTLCDETHYALHEMLSELQPDSALISIALSMLAITKNSTSPFAMSLSFEAERLIQDYGSIWVSNAQNKPLSIDHIFDVVIHVAEDLNGVAELLELHERTMGTKDKAVQELCQILNIQARAQALIAETFMEMADMGIQSDAQVIEATDSNVIPFRAQSDVERVHY